jgi:hypothetical protein
MRTSIPVASIDDQYGTAKQTMSDFKSNKDIFKQHPVTFVLSNSGDISGKKIQKKIYDEKPEEAVYKWYVQQHSNRVVCMVLRFKWQLKG